MTALEYSISQLQKQPDADVDTKRLKFGAYLNSEAVAALYPGLLSVWELWLDHNFDPGHYEVYVVKDQSVLPYIDNHPQRIVTTFMPADIYAQLMILRGKLNG